MKILKIDEMAVRFADKIDAAKQAQDAEEEAALKEKNKKSQKIMNDFNKAFECLPKDDIRDAVDTFLYIKSKDVKNNIATEAQYRIQNRNHMFYDTVNIALVDDLIAYGYQNNISKAYNSGGDAGLLIDIEIFDRKDEGIHAYIFYDLKLDEFLFNPGLYWPSTPHNCIFNTKGTFLDEYEYHNYSKNLDNVLTCTELLSDGHNAFDFGISSVNNNVRTARLIGDINKCVEFVNDFLNGFFNAVQNINA